MCFLFSVSVDTTLIIVLLFVGFVQEINCRDAEGDKDKEDDNRCAKSTL